MMSRATNVLFIEIISLQTFVWRKVFESTTSTTRKEEINKANKEMLTRLQKRKGSDTINKFIVLGRCGRTQCWKLSKKWELGKRIFTEPHLHSSTYMHLLIEVVWKYIFFSKDLIRECGMVIRKDMVTFTIIRDLWLCYTLYLLILSTALTWALEVGECPNKFIGFLG